MLTTFAAIFALCAVSLSLFFFTKPEHAPELNESNKE